MEPSPRRTAERFTTPSMDVVITWGDTLLHAAHLSPPRSFFIGEDPSQSGCVALPEGTVGAPRAPLLLADASGVELVLLPGAAGQIDIAGQRAMTVREAIDEGAGKPVPGIRGAYSIRFPRGSKAEIELGATTRASMSASGGGGGAGVDDARILVRISDDTAEAIEGFAASVAPRETRMAGRSRVITGAVVALHAALLGTAAAAMPPLGEVDEQEARDNTYYMATVLADVAERVDEEPDEATPEPETPWSRALDFSRYSGAPPSWPTRGAHRRYQLPMPALAPDASALMFPLATSMGLYAPAALPGDLDSRHAWPGASFGDQGQGFATPFSPMELRPTQAAAAGSYVARFTRVSVNGQLMVASVARALSSVRMLLGACVVDPIASARPAPIEVELRFIVDRAGAATSIEASFPEDRASVSAARCLRDVLGEASMPAPSTGLARVVAGLYVGSPKTPAAPEGPAWHPSAQPSYSCDAP